MNLIDIVRDSLNDIAEVDVVSDGCLVTTHCLYPSNSFVQVLVRGQNNEYVVSDNAGIVDELLGSGVHVDSPHKHWAHLVPHGLSVSPLGAIVSPVVNRALLGVSIVAVANAAKEIVQWYYETHKVKRTRDFKRLLADLLDRTYDNMVRHHETIVGGSNTPHRFDNVVALPSGTRVIVDPVLPESNSINSRIVAHLDIRHAKHANVEQRLVIDDYDEWSPTNVNLLSVGGVVVTFSKLEPALRRLA